MVVVVGMVARAVVVAMGVATVVGMVAHSSNRPRVPSGSSSRPGKLGLGNFLLTLTQQHKTIGAGPITFLGHPPLIQAQVC